MYTIRTDGKLLYAPHLSDAGCGVFSPQLTVELNKAGSLSFIMPPDNVAYNDISKITSIVTVHHDDEEIFRGRVLNDEKDFYNNKSNYCEGELAFLVDSRQRPYKFEGTVKGLFEQYIKKHNSRVEAKKQFTVGEVTIKDASKEVSIENEEYPSTLDELTDKLLNVYGGYIKIRGSGDNRYIDWLEDSGERSSQTIEFGVNLLDFAEYISAENLFTVLIPTGRTRPNDEGETIDNLTIESVNDGKDYIEDESAISLFGRIEATQSWDNVTSREHLKVLAEEYLATNIELAVTLSVKAVDLSLLDVKWERIRLGDWLQVISLPHNLDRWFQCTKITYDLIDPDKTEYVFGVDYTSLTGQQVSGGKSIQNSVSSVQSTAKSAAAKSNETNQTVSNMTYTLDTEYVKTAVFESYKAEVADMIEGLNERIIELGG